MKREILINGTPKETRVAILEDDTLVELLVDRPDTRRIVGDIYLGKVEAVLPGIQAAFVDIGQEKSAFLHASDMIEPDEDEMDEEEDGGNGKSDVEEAQLANGGGKGNGFVKNLQQLIVKASLQKGKGIKSSDGTSPKRSVFGGFSTIYSISGLYNRRFSIMFLAFFSPIFPEK